jgi:hypothetical protein
MISKNLTRTGVKSKYIGVCYVWHGSMKESFWMSAFSSKGLRFSKRFPFTEGGERQAAICYDKARLENDMEPVNILKRRVV